MVETISKYIISSGILIFIISVFAKFIGWILKKKRVKEYIAFDIFKNEKVCDSIILECENFISGKEKFFSPKSFYLENINMIFASEIALSVFTRKHYVQFSEYKIALGNIELEQDEFIRITQDMKEEVLEPTYISKAFVTKINNLCEALKNNHYNSEIFIDIEKKYREKYNSTYKKISRDYE